MIFFAFKLSLVWLLVFLLFGLQKTDTSLTFFNIYLYFIVIDGPFPMGYETTFGHPRSGMASIGRTDLRTRRQSTLGFGRLTKESQISQLLGFASELIWKWNFFWEVQVCYPFLKVFFGLLLFNKIFGPSKSAIFYGADSSSLYEALGATSIDPWCPMCCLSIWRS